MAYCWGIEREQCSAGAFVKPGVPGLGYGTLCFRTRDMGKATRSVHVTGSFRKLLDLGGRLGAGGCL